MIFNEQIGELSMETIIINTEPNRNSTIEVYTMKMSDHWVSIEHVTG